MDNEDWLIDIGDAIVEKRADGEKLQPIDQLIYCLWVADYSVRNAGDLDSAKDLHPQFLTEGKSLAQSLSLPKTLELFSMDETDFEESFLDMFDEVADELKAALPQ